MSVTTNFITRVNVALAEDTAMLCFGTPSGPVEDGKIGVEEAFRLIVSHRTLREMATLLNKRVAHLDAASQAAEAEQKARSVAQLVTRRSFVEDDTEVVPSAMLQ